MRIGFFGTPSLAAKVFQDLLMEQDMNVVFVVTNPDKPFGRNQEFKASPVKEVAIFHQIPVLQPQKIRENREFLDTIRAYECDYFVVVAYGKILPCELLEIPKKMCINVHGSILPKYRGASPIQSALLHGEVETGVTIMKMSEGMDEGDILTMAPLRIDATETSGSLFQKFETISGKVLIQALRGVELGEISPIAQNHADATYCTKIEKEQGLVDWSQSANEIYHRWQAYTPWPGIFTMHEGKRLLLEKIGMITHESGGINPGTVVKLPDGIVGVVCGKGILTLLQVKLEGKKSQTIKDFVNGNQKFLASSL